MAITYNRTMKIKYEHNEKLSKKQEARLAQALQNKGLTMIDRWWNKIPTYGFKNITTKTRSWGIYFDDELIFEVNYSHKAKEIVVGLSNKFDNVSTDEIYKESTKKQWLNPKGSYLIPNLNDDDYIDDDTWNIKNIQVNTKMTLGNNVEMLVNIDNTHSGMVLEIETYWETDKIQRKEAIEENMVELPLSILGRVQKIVESVLKTKKFGYNVEDVEIDCNFRAMTVNVSECTPDIVKMTREARNNE